MDYSQSTGNPIVYWILYLFLIGMLIFCGYRMGNSDRKSYKKFAWMAIITFSLIEGLRWLRGADYYNYYFFFERGKFPKMKEVEPLFELLGSISSSLHIHPSIVFVLLSGLLIFSFVFICSQYKRAAIWCLPIMMIYLGESAENIVRQYAAISFMIIAYYYFIKNDNIKMWIFLICAPFIHLASFVGVVFFLLFSWKKMPFKYPLLFIGIYCFVYFFWNPDWLYEFSGFIGSLDIELEGYDEYNRYLRETDRVFTIEGSLSGGAVKTLSLISVVVKFLSEIGIIFYGYKACANDKKLHLAYYFAFGGIIMIMISGDIQLLRRFGYYFNWMVPFVIGLIFYKVDFSKEQALKYVLMAIFLIRFGFYGVLRDLGTAPYAGCGFIWDK